MFDKEHDDEESMFDISIKVEDSLLLIFYVFYVFTCYLYIYVFLCSVMRAR